MPHLDVLLIGVIIGEIKRVNTTDAHHRVPHERDRYVLNRRVVIFFELGENVGGAVVVQHHVAGVLLGRDVWREDFLAEVLFDTVDGFQPPDEHAKGVHLGFLRDWREVAFVASPDAVTLELPPAEVVEVLDVLLVAPADKVVQTVLVSFERCLGEFVVLVREVEFQRGVGFDWFQTHGSRWRTRTYQEPYTGCVSRGGNRERAMLSLVESKPVAPIRFHDA